MVLAAALEPVGEVAGREVPVPVVEVPEAEVLEEAAAADEEEAADADEAREVAAAEVTLIVSTLHIFCTNGIHFQG